MYFGAMAYKHCDAAYIADNGCGSRVAGDDEILAEVEDSLGVQLTMMLVVKNEVNWYLG
jgi:hypothetical protein